MKVLRWFLIVWCWLSIAVFITQGDYLPAVFWLGVYVVFLREPADA